MTGELKNRKAVVTMRKVVPASASTVGQILGDIRSLMESARGQAAQAVNAGLVRVYWNIGHRIHREIPHDPLCGDVSQSGDCLRAE